MALPNGAAAFRVSGKEAEAEASEDLLNADLAFSPSFFSPAAQEDLSQQQQQQTVRSSGASNAEGVGALEDEEKLSMQN